MQKNNSRLCKQKISRFFTHRKTASLTSRIIKITERAKNLKHQKIPFTVKEKEEKAKMKALKLVIAAMAFLVMASSVIAAPEGPGTATKTLNDRRTIAVDTSAGNTVEA